MPIKVLAVSSVLPEKVLTNADLEKIVDTSDEWITRMTGIKERHILSGDETYIDCAFRAAKQALANANVRPEDVGMVILGTSTAAQAVPSTAGIIQGLLGIKQCIAFDLQAACSGFVYAMYIAQSIMQNDSSKRYALVLGCDALSKITNWKDRTSCVLFGDGFGAMVLARDDAPSDKGILYSMISSDGKGKQDLEVPWGIGQGYETLEKLGGALVMNGREVFKNSVNYFVKLIEEALEKNNFKPEDIDWVIPHQANLRIIDAVAERLSISREKFVITLDKHGNTSAASIPLAYDAMMQAGKIKSGNLVMFVGFGGGYTWGVVLFRV